MTITPKILIVDDDPAYRQTLTDVLMLNNYEPYAVASGGEALQAIKEESYAVALIDLKLEDMSGLDVLRGIKDHFPETECILLTGFSSQDSAIEAINLGAFSYFRKPYDLEQLQLSIQKAIGSQVANRRIGRLLNNQIAINQLTLNLGDHKDSSYLTL
jgi:DNA-binding NtrC family response regulator